MDDDNPVLPKRQHVPLGSEKLCADCGIVKLVEAFAFKHRATGALQSRCRACQADRSRAAYNRGVDKRRTEIAARRRANKAGIDAAVDEWLEGRSCEVAECTPVSLGYSPAGG